MARSPAHRYAMEQIGPTAHVRRKVVCGVIGGVVGAAGGAGVSGLAVVILAGLGALIGAAGPSVWRYATERRRYPLIQLQGQIERLQKTVKEIPDSPTLPAAKFKSRPNFQEEIMEARQLIANSYGAGEKGVRDWINRCYSKLAAWN